MDNLVFEDFDYSLMLEQQLEEMSKNPPKGITFTYTKEQLEKVIQDFRANIERQKSEIKQNSGYSGYRLEDFREEWTDNEPTPSSVVNTVETYNNLVNKNNIKDVEFIVRKLNSIYSDRMQLPDEITKTITEIKEHYHWLQQIEMINTYNNKTHAEQQQEKLRQEEQLKSQQEQKIQQARYNEIQSKLPIIKEQLNRIRELPKNSNIYESRKIELLKERNYFYQRKNNITSEDIDRLYGFIATLDSIEQEIVNSNQQIEQVEQTPEPVFNIPEQPTKQNQDEINKLKEQINQYDNQILLLFAQIQPYMQVPKVNIEISKVVAKNNEINNSQIIDSLTDYQRVVEIKQSLVSYLEQANKFIKDSVAKEQVQQHTNQSLPDNFWAEFDNSKNNISRPERKFNDDGTYTMEYMAYLVATSPGIEKQVYEQMQQRNDQIRVNNRGLTSEQADSMIQAMVNSQIDTNGQVITKNEDNIYNRNMGFTKIGILALLTSIVSIIIMILGIVLIS